MQQLPLASMGSSVAACSSTLSSQVSAFVTVPTVISTCGSSGGSNSLDGFFGSPTSSPPSTESSSLPFSPFPTSSNPLAPPSGSSLLPPSPVTSSSPRLSETPPYPSAPLDSGSSGGNLASFQNALNGGTPPGGGFGATPSAGNSHSDTAPSGSSNTMPSNTEGDISSFVPAVDNIIG